MRKLNVDDVFNASNLIDLFSLPAVYSKLKDADRSDPEGFARMAMMVLIKEAATESSRRKIYEFLSGPFEIPAEELRGMPFLEFCKGLAQIAEVGEWEAFIRSVQATK